MLDTVSKGFRSATQRLRGQRELTEANIGEALREIRLRHKAKVIIVSSLAQIGSTYSAEVKKLGADGIIDKPGGALDPTLAQKKGEDLKHLINQLVKN
mgnify:CR=1 FL=1